MKRWVACKKVLIDGAYEPAVSVHTDNFKCWSSPSANWMMCKIGIQDLTAISADTDCKILPDISLDLTFGSLPSATRTAVKNDLTAIGVTNASSIANAWTIRRVLAFIGGQLQPNMNPEAGDVNDF